MKSSRDFRSGVKHFPKRIMRYRSPVDSFQAQVLGSLPQRTEIDSCHYEAQDMIHSPTAPDWPDELTERYARGASALSDSSGRFATSSRGLWQAVDAVWCHITNSVGTTELERCVEPMVSIIDERC